MRKPNFFIVGAPKCGTTALFEYLRIHPDVYMPDRKEPRFFGADLDRYNAWFNRDENEYLNLFAAAEDKKRVGEATPWYLYSKTAARELYDFNPYARIVIILRNPADMMHALHSQSILMGRESITDFAAALRAEEDRRAGKRIARVVNVNLQGVFYRDVARYSDQVRRYVDIFGWEGVHVIIFDDFKRNTALVYRKLCEFLEIDVNVVLRFEVVNPNIRIRSYAIHRFVLDPPPLFRTAARLVLSDKRRRAVVEAVNRRNIRTGSRPSLPRDLRKQLQAEFAPEIEKLSALLGRDLTTWVHE